MTLIQLHMATPNIFNSTMRLYRDFFGCLSTPGVKHYFCATCESYFGTELVQVCPNGCSGDIRFFMYIPVATQLKPLFSSNSPKQCQIIINNTNTIYSLVVRSGTMVFSVRLSLRLSHLFDYVPIIVSS